jgi:hypothetical protein
MIMIISGARTAMNIYKQTALPLPKTWDAIRHEPYDSEHQRALEGLPHYWRLSWGFADTIIADCGKHKLLVRVDWLEDPDQTVITSCHYKELGLCE